MSKCTACGNELPPNARFCGNCGHVQEATSYTDAETRRSETPPPSSWSFYNSAAPDNIGTPPPPPPPTGRDEREERKDVPPWLPLYGGGIGLESGQAYPSNAPTVAGTPQISGAPGVSGTPSVPPGAPSGGYHMGQQLAQGAAPPQAPYYPGAHTSYPPVNQPPPQTYPQQQATQWGTQEPQAQHPEHFAKQAAPAHAAATKVAGGIAAKWILVAVAAVVVIGGGGVGLAAYLANRTPPLQPVISIATSPGNYKVGNTLAGASGTSLHITGSKFSNNSTITFLLDGAPAPGSTGAKSDANGTFQTDVKITNGWSPGTHTLTAKDASNNSTQNSVTVMIVSPGQAHTPGPLGAPPDDASFHVNANITGQFGSSAPFTETQTVVITGHPDPMGGSVCESTDNGQPIMTQNSTFNTSTAFQETAVYSCTGTYKAGKFTYTQMLTSDTIKYYLVSPVVTCTLTSPQPNMELSGSYTGNNTFSGTFSFPAISQNAYHCDANGANFFHRAGQVTWTGSVTTQ